MSLAGATACGSPATTSSAPAPTAADTQENSSTAATAEGTLAPPQRAANAYTYDPVLAPEGAYLFVEARQETGSTRVRLQVQGLLPNRGYAVHAHGRPCGPTGTAAGPHYQHAEDPAATPKQPSTDPAYANPQNEIWLDLRTDHDGNAEVEATVPYAFTDRAAESIVIHAAKATSTRPGEAGTAGARVACLTAPLS